VGAIVTADIATKLLAESLLAVAHASTGTTERAGRSRVAYVGEGRATEAARACLAAALGPLGLKRVVALAYPENAQSVRIMQKLGMRDTGTVTAYGHELVCYEATAGV